MRAKVLSCYQFTSFASTKVQIQNTDTCGGSVRWRCGRRYSAYHFTSFTSTNVQILTPEVRAQVVGPGQLAEYASLSAGACLQLSEHKLP